MDPLSSEAQTVPVEPTTRVAGLLGNGITIQDEDSDGIPNLRVDHKLKTAWMTLNNPTEDEIKILLGLYPDTCKYICWGRHTNTQTPHMHIYLSFKNAHTWVNVKKMCPRADIRTRAVDNLDKIRRYCNKSGMM